MVIATYKRHDILKRCLTAALGQSVLPAEIIVVDSSPNFDDIAEEFRREFARDGIRFTYERGRIASSTAQRNQGIALSSAPILFLIDDDSLMYPDCAEEILKVYGADPTHRIAGVSAIGVPVPPDRTEQSSEDQELPKIERKPSSLRRLVSKALRTRSTEFIPSDRKFPAPPLPPEVPADTIGRIRFMAGYAMTFRREALLSEPFDEVLERYAAGEDQDTSYRISRAGALVNAVRARLCHVEAKSGRLSPYVVAVLANLNPVVLHRKFSTDLQLSRRRLLTNMSHRLVISAIKESVSRSYTFPRTRGVAYSILRFNDVWKKDSTQLKAWYPEFQSELISKSEQARST